MNETPEFDSFADRYDADLNRALAATGEDKDYFAQGRVEWLRRCLERLGEHPHSVLDYGCGIGDTSHLLERALAARSVTGVDASARTIGRAREKNSSDSCQFSTPDEYLANGVVDLAYCNGVFHHIPVPMRDAALRYVWACLRPGGFFAFWENNPWNPGTRHVMAQCAFDRGAVTISPPQASRMLRRCGFEVVATDYCFFFPRALKFLRVLEPRLARLPIGAQYQVLCRKPVA